MVQKIKKNNYLFISILLLCYTLTIFGPIELYYTNYEEFWFNRWDMFKVSLLLFLICAFFLLLIGFLAKGKIRDLYSCIIFFVGIALYIQGNYVNINYGILNGDEIQWGAYTVYAFFDTLGWIMILVGGCVLWLKKRDLCHKVQKIVAICVILIQTVTLIILFFTTDVSSIEKSKYYLSDEGLYEVSSNENIFIFVLDAFDDAFFQELLKEEPKKYQEMFEDFIHYNNAVVGGTATKIGMPAIITGMPYPGEVSYTEYVKQAFDCDGLYSVLQKKDYDTRLYTESSFVPDGMELLVNNQVSTGYKVSSYSKLAQKYLSLTLYRYMPHLFKRFFWIYTGDFDQYKSGSTVKGYVVDDAVYYKNLEKHGLVVNSDKNIFKLVHLNGAHPPYNINEYAQHVGSDHTTQELQRKGALYIIEHYISKLKTLGVYDSSTIIILADHGRLNEEAHGVLLVKERNHKGAFEEKSTPVSYYDLHATIFGVLGVADEDTFFSVPEDMERERYFYWNDTAAGNMRIVEYRINGDINDPSSINKTGKVLVPDLSNKRYQYGTLLSFGAENTAVQYIVGGISSTDMDVFSWTDGQECEFEFELEHMPKNNLELFLNVMTIYEGKKGSQQIILYANDKKCFSKILSSGTELHIVIPGSVVSDDRKLRLRMEIPDAVAPADLFGPGNDVRVLGLAIVGLSIQETKDEAEVMQEEPNDISDLTFGVDGNATPYMIDGWYEPEDGHVWSGETAQILLKTNQLCDYTMVIQCSQYHASGNTMVYVNDTAVATLNGDDTGFVIHIPYNLLDEDGNQIVTFETQDAISPSEAGEDEDKRTLGICLYSISVNESKTE